MNKLQTPILALTVLFFATTGLQAKYLDDETDLVYYGHRYYNPSTGKWLSRDPMEEAAFVSNWTEALNQDFTSTAQNTGSLYGFCNNEPISDRDYLGLLVSTTTIGGGVPTRGILEHRSYLSFTATCPVSQKVVFLSVDYSGAVPGLSALFGASRVTALAGPIPPAAGLGGFRHYGGDGPNCNGTPVEIQVFMRTRFASYSFGKAAAAAAYAAGTTVTYGCVACSFCSNISFNPVLPYYPY